MLSAGSESIYPSIYPSAQPEDVNLFFR